MCSVSYNIKNPFKTRNVVENKNKKIILALSFIYRLSYIKDYIV